MQLQLLNSASCFVSVLTYAFSVFHNMLTVCFVKTKLLNAVKKPKGLPSISYCQCLNIIILYILLPKRLSHSLPL